jgi:hypothetical protein
MSSKFGWAITLVAVLLSAVQARAQGGATPPTMMAWAGLIAGQPEFAPAPAGANVAQPEEIPTQPKVSSTSDDSMQPQPGPGQPELPRPGLSDWITYNRNGCCSGPVGNHLPLMHELFLRAGVAATLPNTSVGSNLNAGWEIEGGGRILLFNPPATKAWALEAGISTVENWHGTLGTLYPLNVIVNGTRVKFGTGGVPGVAIRGLNRTFVNLGGGREWYLFGSAIEPGRKLRVGIDGGGRYGSAKMDLTKIPHRTDVISGLYAGAHLDLECPFAGACVLYTGLRVEWDYTWMDILQTKSDIMGINALANFGFRW